MGGTEADINVAEGCADSLCFPEIYC
jgi:hypothetical protein